MKKFAFLLAAMLGLSVPVMGDNLLKNGEFERTNANGTPANWIVAVPKGGSCKTVTTGAPDGGSVTFTLPEQGKFSLRQLMTKALQPNTKYKVSFKLRGKNFKASVLGMAFINEGWSKANGNFKLQVTEKWQEYEEIYTTPDFKKQVWLVFYGLKAAGTVEICDVEVAALDND